MQGIFLEESLTSTELQQQLDHALADEMSTAFSGKSATLSNACHIIFINNLPRICELDRFRSQ